MLWQKKSVAIFYRQLKKAKYSQLNSFLRQIVFDWTMHRKEQVFIA
jgi:hypothetical protein